MEDDAYFQELKEKEIKRLITPLTRKKIKGKPDEVYDCDGNLVACTNNKDYVLEPNDELLSYDEILKYAPKSKKASEIRLKTGVGTLSDKIKVYTGFITAYILFSMCVGMVPFVISPYLGIFVIIILIIIPIYFLFVYDFEEKDFTKVNLTFAESKVSYDNELWSLFESKEKIAREMIEKRFPAPQMTNIKFNGVLDNCKQVVESQINILNSLTPTEKTKYEIESRKQLIKQVIGKIDDLTNELILSEESNLEEVIDEMDMLVNSVKEYK